jgi:hypothetical protein
VCSDASLFSCYQVTRDSSVMMGNGLMLLFVVLAW